VGTSCPVLGHHQYGGSRRLVNQASREIHEGNAPRAAGTATPTSTSYGDSYRFEVGRRRRELTLEPVPELASPQGPPSDTEHPEQRPSLFGIGVKGSAKWWP
jgi:hypothetical protein